ncbi:MAG: glycoside hydrolase family 9 protein [Oscillospiraceae bacterium]|nr:glycoside hydrolase family 9 protein [Oscillospiraceae bacterium]
MKSSKLLNRLKAAVTCAAVAVTALVAPAAVTEEKADAAVSVNYAKALQYSLYLYDANMCGPQVGETSQLDWRDDCHTYDSSVSTPYGTMDLSGGFHDAGDHVKFGLPGAYSATMLGWGYYEFKNAFTQTGQAAHLQTITDYFCDYFKRCTVMNGSTVQAFCYQVGDGDTDHAQWCPPENQTLARPVYFATSSNPCTDVVAETAAALAMNYINFGNKEDLTYAQALYSFAKSNNKANHQSQSYYQGSCYLDDLALASILLYKATNTASYKSDCASWISQSNWAYTTNQPLCWDSVWPAVNAIYANEWNRVSANIDVLKNGNKTPQGYACHSNWGSARYNTAQQLMGLVYDKYNNSSSYTAWAKGQMEYLLGNNNAGYCYMVGYNSNSVTQPHHRAASGYNDFPSENRGVPYKHVLVGALVGGPDNSDNYYDEADKYEYTEVATDYNAAFVGALAGLYLKYGSGQSVDSSVPGVSGGTVTPPTTTTTTTTTPVTTVTTTTSTTVSSFTHTTTTSSSTSASTPKTTSTSVTQGNPTNGTKVVTVNTKLDMSSDSGKFTQIKISDFLPEGAKAEKIIVNFSANGDIGSPSMTGGISVTSSGNWKDLGSGTMNINGSSGTVEFDVQSIQDEIQYDGVFQIGCWWCQTGTVNIDTITCIYSSTSINVPETTVSTTSTTAKTTVSTVTTTAKTTAKTTAGNDEPTVPDVEPSMYGDVNLDGDISVSDVVKLNLYLLNPAGNPLSDVALANADCVPDGVIDTSDSSLIMNYTAMVISKSQLGK